LKKIPSQKKACGVAQDEVPEFKPQHCKKKKGIYKLIVAFLMKLGAHTVLGTSNFSLRYLTFFCRLWYCMPIILAT
jgi:hypothetical protein